jgi:hypothetical protein
VYYRPTPLGDLKVHLTASGRAIRRQNQKSSLYVDDCDAVFNRAIEAGGTVKEPITDKFYGDRSGSLADPFGHLWHVGTHKEDVSPQELDRRMKEMFATGQPSRPKTT